MYIEAVSKEFMIPFESLDKMVKKLALSYSGEGYTDRYNENEVNEEIERDLKKSKKHLEDGVKQAQKILLTWLIEDENIYGKNKFYISIVNNDIIG